MSDTIIYDGFAKGVASVPTKGLTIGEFDDISVVPFPEAPSNTFQLSSSSVNDIFDISGTGVIRIEYMYILADGTKKVVKANVKMNGQTLVDVPLPSPPGQGVVNVRRMMSIRSDPLTNNPLGNITAFIDGVHAGMINIGQERQRVCRFSTGNKPAIILRYSVSIVHVSGAAPNITIQPQSRIGIGRDTTSFKTNWIPFGRPIVAHVQSPDVYFEFTKSFDINIYNDFRIHIMEEDGGVFDVAAEFHIAEEKLSPGGLIVIP